MREGIPLSVFLAWNNHAERAGPSEPATGYRALLSPRPMPLISGPAPAVDRRCAAAEFS